MKFTATALGLLAGTVIAAPASMALPPRDTDTTLAPPSDAASPLHARLWIPQSWFDQSEKPEAGTETTEDGLNQRSPILIFSDMGTPKDGSGRVQRRDDLISDKELASIGQALVEAVEGLSSGELEELSRLAVRDDLAASDRMLMARNDGQIAERGAFVFFFAAAALVPLIFDIVDKLKNGKGAGLQRRNVLFSDPELVSIGRTVVETFNGLSPEELEQISGFSPRDTGDPAAFDGLLESRGNGPAIERRFLENFVEALIEFLKAKLGLDKPPVNTPALARRYFPAFTPNLVHANKATPQKEEDKLERRAEAVFNEMKLADEEKLVLEAMEECFPEQYSRLLGLDGNAVTSLTRRGFFIPALVVGWAVSVIVAAVDASMMAKRKNANRDLEGLNGVGEAFNHNLATLQMPEAVKEYLQEHTLLDAFAEVFPGGLESITESVARDETDLAGTSSDALVRRSPWIALPVGVVTFLVVFTVGLFTTSTSREDGHKAHRRAMDGAGPAFDTELVKIVLENLGEYSPEDLEHVPGLWARDVDEDLEKTDPGQIEMLLKLVPEWSEVDWPEVEVQVDALLRGLGYEIKGK